MQDINPVDGLVYTNINIVAKQPCTYWFKEGMMVLDFGMAVDAPGDYFKKLRK